MFRKFCYILPSVFLIIVHLQMLFVSPVLFFGKIDSSTRPIPPIMQDKVLCIFEYERVRNIFNEVTLLSFGFTLQFHHTTSICR